MLVMADFAMTILVVASVEQEPGAVTMLKGGGPWYWAAALFTTEISREE